MKFEKQELKVMVDEKNLKGIIEAANKGVEINRESYERLVFDACYMHSNDNGLLLRRLLGKEFNFIREKKGEALPLSNLKWPDIERLLSERLVVVGELRVGDMVSSLFKYDSELSDYMRIAEKFMFSGEIDGACDSITSLLIVIGSIYAAENCPKNCEPSHLNGSSVSDDKEECKKLLVFLYEIYAWHLENYSHQIQRLNFEVLDDDISKYIKKKLHASGASNILELIIKHENLLPHLEALLNNGLNPNYILGYLNIPFQHEGANLIMGAAAYGNCKGIELLLHKGADLNIEDGYGHKPYKFAEARRKKKVLKLIDSKLAVLGEN